MTRPSSMAYRCLAGIVYPDEPAIYIGQMLLGTGVAVIVELHGDVYEASKQQIRNLVIAVDSDLSMTGPSFQPRDGVAAPGVPTRTTARRSRLERPRWRRHCDGMGMSAGGRQTVTSTVEAGARDGRYLALSRELASDELAYSRPRRASMSVV
ncbi:MAG TPA: hypothetical protein VF221_12505 [Chloroflexota bacterium]